MVKSVFVPDERLSCSNFIYTGWASHSGLIKRSKHMLDDRRLKQELITTVPLSDIRLISVVITQDTIISTMTQ
jgi:hypothetical protein